MNIYIIRHGAAVDLDKDIADDAFRYLNKVGREKSKDVAKKLKKLKAKFDIIISSPLVRAVQTAEIFASVLNFKGEVKTAIELMGGYSPSKFNQLIYNNSVCKSLAFIGHAPAVYHFAANLIQKKSGADPKIHFHNSSVFKIDYDLTGESGKFVYFLDSSSMEVIKEKK
jgi:phosphohistidine phosphatase